MYTLPIKNSIITGHKDGDADSISSCAAVAEFLKGKGVKAFIKLTGQIAPHMVWMLSGHDVVDTVPEDVEQVIVLDSGPEKERVGWDIPDTLKLVNIDHHKSRFDLHCPRKRMYIVDRCATAAVLILDFGIKNTVLMAGLYGDTQFTKSLNEVQRCLKKLTYTDEQAETILTGLKPFKDRRVLDAVRDAKARFCRNGFLIVELKDNEEPAVIQEIMKTLNNYSESVCLLQQNNRVLLRSRNPNIDLSTIAGLYGGGGHSYASGVQLPEGKRSALKSLIVSLDIEPNVIEVKDDLQEETEEKDV